MICCNCGEKIGDGVMPQILHGKNCIVSNDLFDGINIPSKKEFEEMILNYPPIEERERKVMAMNGMGVYVNTIDEPNVVIIPEHTIEHLKKHD